MKLYYVDIVIQQYTGVGIRAPKIPLELSRGSYYATTPEQAIL